MPKTVLVTGASSGIGATIAGLFHRRGFMVFGTSRSADPNSVHEFPILKLDVNSDASAKACVDEVLARAGRLDVLVNNAGFALSGAAEETSIEEAKEQFETNFFGVAHGEGRFAPHARGTYRQDYHNWLVEGLMAIPYNAFYSSTNALSRRSRLALAPRLKNAAPWNFFASGVRRTFELDSPSRSVRPVHTSSQHPLPRMDVAIRKSPSWRTRRYGVSLEGQSWITSGLPTNRPETGGVRQ